MYNGNVKQLFTLYALVMRNLSNDVTKPSYSYIHIIGIHEVHEKAFSLTVKWLRNIDAGYLPLTNGGK